MLLTSGVYGFITGMDEADDVVWVEIDDDVQIRVSRDAILRQVVPPTPPLPRRARRRRAPMRRRQHRHRQPPAAGRPTLKGRLEVRAAAEPAAAPAADADPTE